MDRRKFLLTAAAIPSLGISTRGWAQEAPSLNSVMSATHPYAVNAQSGKWMILVKSYIGLRAPVMAEEFCTTLRRDYRLPAYMFNRGAEAKQAEQARIAAIQAKQQEFFKSMNAQVMPSRGVRTIRIEEQLAVLVGGYSDMESARKGLDQLRKLPPPKATHLLDSTNISSEGEKGQEVVRQAFLNPFLNAFVVPNPTIARDADPDADKPDPIIKELNANDRLSVLRCQKDWTMVVKVYQVPVIVQSSSSTGDFFKKLVGNKSKDYLTAIAKQAGSLAEFLRSMKPTGFEAYVMHTRHSSIICVGQYDSATDPTLQQNAKLLAGMKLGTVDQLMAQPLPMKIPRF